MAVCDVLPLLSRVSKVFGCLLGSLKSTVKWSSFFYFLPLVPANYLNFFLPPCCSPIVVAPACTGTERRTLCFGAVIHTEVTHSLLVKSASPLMLSHSIPVTSALPPPPAALHTAPRPCPTHTWLNHPTPEELISLHYVGLPDPALAPLLLLLITAQLRQCQLIWLGLFGNRARF